MANSEYKSQRALARALGTDGSLVGKWLNGEVLEVKSVAHREQLPKLLSTPADYFSDPPRGDRLATLEAEGEDLRVSVIALLHVCLELVEAVQELGGDIPDAAIEELAQAALHMRAGAQPS